uniref:Uncharacterized protein n=1 Tax=Siphoviridae sp. ctk5O4 TaxID=2827921 RepID=A0A8S5SL11_9CAUD|nr:MAG TPA: hypothetical protein [Siphoviridae sp. ctk5O4]
MLVTVEPSPTLQKLRRLISENPQKVLCNPRF